MKWLPRNRATHYVGRGFSPARKLWDAVMRDEPGISASSFAYHMLFAIPPLVILTVTIAALLSRVTSVDIAAQLQQLIEDHAPEVTKSLLNEIVKQAVVRVSSGGASIGVAVTALLALWSGSAAVGSLIRAFNRAYGVEETRPFVQRTRLKLILTLFLALAINFAFAAVVFGHRIGEKLADEFDLSARFNRVWNLLLWPAAVAVVALLLATLYYAGPNVDLSFRWISPGSAMATTLWLGAAALFGWYLGISNPGSAYGAVGNIVVLLFFLDVTGWIFLLGAKLNAEIGKRFDPLTMSDLALTAPVEPGVRASARRRFRRWLSKGAVRRRDATQPTRPTG